MVDICPDFECLRFPPVPAAIDPLRTLARCRTLGKCLRNPRLNASKGAARRIKPDVIALCLAARDPRVPWYAKAVVAMVAAYALSPIDLIPDFVPVLGNLDDLLIVALASRSRSS